MYVNDDPNATYKLLAQEFKKKHYTFEEEEVNGRKVVVYTSPRGKTWRTSASRISYPFTSAAMRDISRNKEIAYRFAEKHGVTTPFTLYLPLDKELSLAEVKSLFKKYPTLIVKPSNSSLARGLTLNIRTSDELRTAIAYARDVSSAVLIQEQVEGEEIRFAVINGKVVAALLRRTPRVVGDGVTTLQELIKLENKARISSRFGLLKYPMLSKENVDVSFLTSQIVPKKGEIVELNRATMVRHGSSMYHVIDEIHPSYIQKVEDLGAHLGTKFAVIDVCVKDFYKPLNKRNYWFIEFNTSPVLSLFYGTRDNKTSDIIKKLVSCIDEYLHDATRDSRTIIGSIESTSFPDLCDEVVLAKVDTGAYSGALYATQVRQKTDENGKKYLQFAPFGNTSQLRKSYDFYKRQVRSAHGDVISRYVVKVKLKINDQFYETDIGLSDRSDMKYPVLIGRKFLREHRMLVDVIVNEELDYEKEILG